jgi:hypothetical protein
MANQKIITPLTQGIDMRVNKLALSDVKGHYAKNITFNENTIKTRPSIAYHCLSFGDSFRGVIFHNPKSGLSAVPVESGLSEQLVLATSNSILQFPITSTCDIGEPIKHNANFDERVFMWSAENYVFVCGPQSPTIWINHNNKIKVSKGTDLECDSTTHDTFDIKTANHFLPHNSNTGVYIHGRNVMSKDIGLNDVTLASDNLGKRMCPDNQDITLMEEQVAFSDLIGCPSEMGHHVGFSVLNIGDLNGEGALFEFREYGIMEHNLIGDRETRHARGDGDYVVTKEGWDKRRISRKRTNEIGAVSPYAITRTPKDIFFQSQYGYHFLKRSIGEGSFDDETTDVLSHDIEPLLDFNCNTSNASTGHWIEGNHFFGTVGHDENGNTRSFVSANQASTFTEDGTPKFLWEGAWQLDTEVSNLERFTRYSRKKGGFGLVASTSKGIYLGKFDNKACGADYRDGVYTPVECVYESGRFACTGLDTIDKVTDGVLQCMVNEHTKFIKVYVRTDKSCEWKLWKSVNISVASLSNGCYNLGAAPSESQEGTFFEFRLEVVGYIEVINWQFEYKEVQKKQSINKAMVSPVGNNTKTYL